VENPGPSLAEPGCDWKNASLAGSDGAGGWEGHLGNCNVHVIGWVNLQDFPWIFP